MNYFPPKKQMFRNKKKYFLSTLLSVVALSAQAQATLVDYLTKSIPKRETRAVWLTTLANLDWPKTHARSEESVERQKQELIAILDKYQAANINTVLLQTRVRATTIYPSAYEPWDRCITGVEGKAPSYDPLAFAVKECHKRGMELHAWIATIPIGAKNGLGCRTLMKKGLKVKEYSSGAYLNPADPTVAVYLAKLCGEIVSRYDVDGINLDYIRYPDGWPAPTYRNGDSPMQRRRNITAIVRAIYDKVKSIRPSVKMSCSPIGKYADLSRYSSKNFNARDRVSQEAQEWLKQGLMDQLYPMQYFRGDNYYPFVADWVENASRREIVSGLGTYFLDPREGRWTIGDLTRQMYVSRSLGAGHAHFRSKFLTDNHQGVYNFERQFNATPSLPHAMQGVRSSVMPPTAVQASLAERQAGGTVVLRWNANAPFYNVYVSRTYPVDTEDAHNLLCTRYPARQLRLRKVDEGYYFAVRAMDSYGNESAALQEKVASEPTAYAHRLLLPNDGKTVSLPAMVDEAAVDHYVICTLQGVALRRISAKAVRERQLVINTLPEGMYSVRIDNRKKKHFRIGYFMVKREKGA